MSTTYVALLHRANKPRAEYGVIFPDFLGCVSAGKTLDKALQNARKGLILHIEGMQATGEPIPNPSTLEDILADPEYADAIPALITIIVPTGQLKRINICLDAGLLAEIDRIAKACKQNRSEFLAYAARERLA